MAENPSRHVSYASRTVEVRDDDYDETLNEDVTCEVDIHDDPKHSTREKWNLDLSKAALVYLVMFAFQVSYLCLLFVLSSFQRCTILFSSNMLFFHSVVSLFLHMYPCACHMYPCACQMYLCACHMYPCACHMYLCACHMYPCACHMYLCACHMYLCACTKCTDCTYYWSPINTNHQVI